MSILFLVRSFLLGALLCCISKADELDDRLSILKCDDISPAVMDIATNTQFRANVDGIMKYVCENDDIKHDCVMEVPQVAELYRRINDFARTCPPKARNATWEGVNAGSSIMKSKRKRVLRESYFELESDCSCSLMDGLSCLQSCGGGTWSCTTAILQGFVNMFSNLACIHGALTCFEASGQCCNCASYAGAISCSVCGGGGGGGSSAPPPPPARSSEVGAGCWWSRCYAGSYCASGGACYTCPGGYYCPGPHNGFICSSGTYSQDGASSCSSCPSGTSSYSGDANCFSTSPPPPPPPPPTPPRAYDQFESVDSNGNDIKQIQGMDISGLKKACDALENCVGFNSAGWMKKVIVQRKDWYTNNYGQNLFVISSLVPALGPPPPPPPPLREYQGFSYFDSDLNDIQYRNDLSGNVNALKRACDALSNCVGFNTGGWLKKQIVTANQWKYHPSGGDLYVLSNILPDLVQDYTQFRKKDSGGNDLKNYQGMSVIAMKAVCDATEQCSGFNSDGWLKNLIKPQSQWTNSDGWIIVRSNLVAALQPPPPPPPPTPARSYAMFEYTDSNGGDISSRLDLMNNIPALKAVCDSTPNCIAFNSYGWLKNVVKSRANWTPSYSGEFFVVKGSVPLLCPCSQVQCGQCQTGCGWGEGGSCNANNWDSRNMCECNGGTLSNCGNDAFACALRKPTVQPSTAPKTSKPSEKPTRKPSHTPTRIPTSRSKCRAGQYYALKSNRCISCPQGMISTAGSFKCWRKTANPTPQPTVSDDDAAHDDETSNYGGSYGDTSQNAAN